MTWWQWIGIAGAAFALMVAAGIFVGRIIRAGTAHLDEPLPPHSMNGGRPWLR